MPPVSMPRQAKIGVFGGLEMLHDDVGERFLVARAEKIDHALMLAPDHLEQRGIADAIRTDRVRFKRRLFDHLDEWHVEINSAAQRSTTVLTT